MKITVKQLASFSIIVILYLFVKILVVRKEKHDAQQVSKKYIEFLHEQSKRVISQRDKEIEYLMRRNAILDIQNEKSNQKIDSLERLKNKTQYVYNKRIKEIDNYDAKQLEKYWQNEFN